MLLPLLAGCNIGNVITRIAAIAPNAVTAFVFRFVIGTGKQKKVSPGEVLLQAERIRSSLKSNKHTAMTLYDRYTDSDDPWCILDTYLRHLEREFHYFDFQVGIHDSLIQLVAAARQNYVKVVDQLSSQFIKAYKKGGF